MKGKNLFSFVMIFLCLVLGGCESVEAWERGTLAKPEMAIETNALETTLNNHIYFSKEASNGGHSATGGGCGCN